MSAHAAQFIILFSMFFLSFNFLLLMSCFLHILTGVSGRYCMRRDARLRNVHECGHVSIFCSPVSSVCKCALHNIVCVFPCLLMCVFFLSVYLFLHMSVTPFISFICPSLHSSPSSVHKTIHLLHLSVNQSIFFICPSLHPSPSSARHSIHLLHLHVNQSISFICPSLHSSPSYVRHSIHLLHLSVTPSISFICPSLHSFPSSVRHFI